jgi:DNA transposition AAA+ family ATPase
LKHSTIQIKNVTRLVDAGEALIRRAPGMPGMGLVWGATGYGKSTAVAWFVNRVNGVHVRALAVWSPAAMLDTIARELELAPKGSCARVVEACARKLSETNRPLFIDEADYVVEKKVMTETLRDLHDLTGVPVILVGMEGIQRSIRARQQLTGRLAQWVEMQPCDIEDARMLADGLLDVRVGQELLARLHKRAAGSARLITVGLGRIEAYAKARGMKSIDAGEWKMGEEFFWGDAPARGRVEPKAPVTPLRETAGAVA